MIITVIASSNNNNNDSIDSELADWALAKCCGCLSQS